MQVAKLIQITFDQNKAESNKIKHGVSFDEAKIALLDPNALVREDFDHDEPRFVLLEWQIAYQLLSIAMWIMMI